MTGIYVDTDFYENEFLLGDSPVIPLTSFMRFARDASQLIDMFTFNRLIDFEEIPHEVAMATCAVAEILYTDTSSNQADNVQSQNMSGYSISFRDNRQSRVNVQSNLRATITKWLTHVEIEGVPLLYRG